MAKDQPPRAERRRLTHVDRSGRPRMVDVSEKAPTARRAVAEAAVAVSDETMSLVIDGGGPKGDVLGVAELAGVMGGKRTSELIPLCHPLALTDLVVSVTPDRGAGVLRVRAEAATTGPTGVEMEALTAASVAALTIYDMVKGVERGVEIRSVHLVSKTGGKSGEWHRPGDAGQGDGAVGDAAFRRRPGARVAGRIGGQRRRSAT
jgi:cyclic pyranopterin phosphate synthase